MSHFSITMESLFAAALFLNAILFLPQAFKIYKKSKADEISLITYIGFLITQLLTISHAATKHDYILLVGYILAFISCGLIVLLTLYYRFRTKSVNYE